MNRRTALKSLAGLALAPMLARCGGDPAKEPLVNTIDTVVLVMMENRSFDHFLGALTLEGRADVDGLHPSMRNPHPTLGEVPVFADHATCLEDPPHGWDSSRVQLGQGKNDGFINAFLERHPSQDARRVMGYLTRAQLPITYALADAGVVCDRSFASVMSSTWPNRLYSLAGQNGGARGNETLAYDFPSILSRLEKAGLTYGAYYGNLSFCFLLRDFSVTQARNINDFAADAEAGTLPNFTIVEPTYGINSDHPPEHPISGQLFLSGVLDALGRGPQWERSLVIITYDEHGGFFDHVPPPTVNDERADEGFGQLGFRVPTLLVGPYVKRGTALHTVLDHCSILATLERLFGLEPLTLRDREANDFLRALDAYRIDARRPHTPPLLPVLNVHGAVLEGRKCEVSTQPFVFGSTGQPELERYAQRHIRDARFERLRQGADLHAAFVRQAEARGLLRLHG